MLIALEREWNQPIQKKKSEGMIHIPAEVERNNGRIYLADYFDETSIENDKILYLAFHKCMERMEKEVPYGSNNIEQFVWRMR